MPVTACGRWKFCAWRGRDVFLRTLGMAGNARKSYEKLQPQTRTILAAYADGVNAYRTRKTRLFESTLQPEFLILGHTPEPWQAWQSGLVLKVMALTLGQNMGKEIQRLALAWRRFGPREIEDILPYGPRDNPVPLPDLRELYGFGVVNNSEADSGGTAGRQFGDAKQFMWPTGETASNNWVISGSRTESGKPILANDPHLGLTAPSVFYLAHLSFMKEGTRRHVIGGSLPGTPLILAGRNARVAWGLTTTGLDSQDLFIERINPDNPDEYLTPNGWTRFGETEETITISGENAPWSGIAGQLSKPQPNIAGRPRRRIAMGGAER